MLRFGIRAPLRFAAAALVAAGACIGAPGALAGGLAFTHPMKLPNSPPKGDLQGGEPSVAFDSDGRHVYVVAPGGGENGGVGFWRSADGGRSFPRGRSLGSLVGGGDSDVDVGPDHTVYITDLEVAANALCRSHDHGRTFDSNCDTGLAGNQAGPDSDREWVSPSPTNPHRVYLTYHDFATETPLVYRSDAGGDFGTFDPCGPILAPGSDAFQNYIPGGTNVGKPAIGAGGALYVPIFEPDAGDQVTEPYDHFYLAIARHGACDLGMPFQDVTVFGNPNANLANIFPYVATRGKTVYAAATGISGTRGGGKAPDHHYGVYLFRSRDRGRHWSKPIAVDRHGLNANALASLTVGGRGRDVALGFYGTKTTGDPASASNRWRFEVARSDDFGRGFSYQRITKHPIHYGQICTTGILCTNGRNLLDFSSIGVNPRTGCLIAVFAGDPYDTPANGKDDPAAPYVSRQKGGCFSR